MPSMSASSPSSSAKYWGYYLIKPDKTPSPLFEQLLLGIAKYINRHVAPWDIHCLTPTKLAAFYRLVGGDYDPLFLDTPSASLSFIYQSLGCFHSLQPEKDPYRAPFVPALTAQGFVRWQTVQLLLEPDEHAPFLQEAVKRFEIINPTDGELFPSVLPREVLPSKPDPQLTAWHERVSQKLMIEAQSSTMRMMPPRPPVTLNLGDNGSHSRPTSRDTQSIDDSVETSSLVGAADYFAQPRTFLHPRQTPAVPIPRSSDRLIDRGVPPSYPWQTTTSDESRVPLRRRSSMPPYQPSPQRPTSWAPGRGIPMDKQPVPSAGNHHRPQNHTRTSSSLSTDSYTSDSSYTTSSASMSPSLVPARTYPSTGPPALLERQHSAYQQDPAPTSPTSPRNLNHTHTFSPIHQHHHHYHQHHHHVHPGGANSSMNGSVHSLLSSPTGSSSLSGSSTFTPIPLKGTSEAIPGYGNPGDTRFENGSNTKLGTSTSNVGNLAPAPEFFESKSIPHRVHRSSTVRAPIGLDAPVPTERKDSRSARSADGRRLERRTTNDRERGQSVGAGNGGGRRS